MSIKRSRKPVLCPVCNGVPYRPATETDPAEVCTFCQRRGRVSQRAERAYRTAFRAISRPALFGDRQIFPDGFDVEAWLNAGMPF